MTNKERIEKLKTAGINKDVDNWTVYITEDDGVEIKSDWLNLIHREWDWLLQLAQEGLEAKEKLEEVINFLKANDYFHPTTAMLAMDLLKIIQGDNNG